jgi:Na+/melibiose symporter-like transporter
MARIQRGRMNPWLLLAMGVALIAAGFFFYTDHPVRESNLYAPSVPGWISVGMFIGIGVLARIVRIQDQRRDAEKRKRDALRET